MSHLVADTSQDLQEAAQTLGLERHIQYPGTWKEHLDVSESKRQEAVRYLAALEITGRELVRILRKKRDGRIIETDIRNLPPRG